jgi:hypothetical protein
VLGDRWDGSLRRVWPLRGDFSTRGGGQFSSTPSPALAGLDGVSEEPRESAVLVPLKISTSTDCALAARQFLRARKKGAVC